MHEDKNKVGYDKRYAENFNKIDWNDTNIKTNNNDNNDEEIKIKNIIAIQLKNKSIIHINLDSIDSKEQLISIINDININEFKQILFLNNID